MLLNNIEFIPTAVGHVLNQRESNQKSQLEFLFQWGGVSTSKDGDALQIEYLMLKNINCMISVFLTTYLCSLSWLPNSFFIYKLDEYYFLYPKVNLPWDWFALTMPLVQIG